ncbi:hypothetical protein AC1031_011645 [Aphanomyces cochlioides]|nr:hypothetical protein AC1031_011645 [Aphanomyces cochlioides]
MIPESCTLSGLLKPGKKVHPLCVVLENECREMGIEPTLANVLKYRIPVHQILRVVNHDHVFSFERAPHARLISRKRTKLLKALQEYSLVAHVHINGQAPNKSFARVERPQERYFLSGEEFEDIASFGNKDWTSLVTQRSCFCLLKSNHSVVLFSTRDTSLRKHNKKPLQTGFTDRCGSLHT